MKLYFIPVFCLGIILTSWPSLDAQSPEVLKLKNKSFAAHNQYFVIPSGWAPHAVFLGQMPVKSLRYSRFYREEEKSQDGNTHIALATYSNGIRENIGQKLRYPMIPGHTYSMNLWLAWSPTRTTVHPIQTLQYPEFDLRPIKIQVFGFASSEDMTNNLLAETPVIDHAEWANYKLRWENPGKYEYIYLVATCLGDEAYNGNILMDHVSDIQVLFTRAKNKK